MRKEGFWLFIGFLILSGAGKKCQSVNKCHFYGQKAAAAKISRIAKPRLNMAANVECFPENTALRENACFSYEDGHNVETVPKQIVLRLGA